jgi:hypothetical protein
MTHKSFNKPFVVAGLTLCLMAGVMLPLCIARAAPPADMVPETGALRRAAVLATFTSTPTFTPTNTSTATLSPPPTETLPTDTPAPTLVVTLTKTVTPTDAPSPSPTQTPTQTPVPTFTPAPTEEQGQEDTPVPAATLTAEAASTEAVTPTPTDTPTSTPAVAPTEAPPPTGVPTPTLDIEAVLRENWPLAAGGCVAAVAFALGVLLILLALRRRKPKPKLPPKPRPEVAAPGAYLESVGTAGGPRRFPLKPDGVTIGRAQENDLVITQDFPGWDTISRHHARIYQHAGYWAVEDLGSMNGVWVNGRRTGRNLLEDGWQLRIGGVEFVFHAGVGEAAQ